MTKYLIRDANTNVYTRTEAPSVLEALIKHENDRPDRHAELPANTKVSCYSEGDNVDASLGSSDIRGHRANVVR